MSGANSPRRAGASPNFLGNDPYPSNPNSRPMSGASELSSAYETAASERSVHTPSWTGPAGESGDFPSRPTTGAYTLAEQTPRASIPQQPPSRRMAGSPLRRGDEPMFISGGRPTSALGRNHVPSITAQGFFRPMSPATIQAQRNHTSSPTSFAQVTPPRVTSPARGVNEEDVHGRRYSNASVNTLRDRPPTSRMEDVPPLPSSRASDFIYSSGPNFGPTGPGSVVSKGSTTPLRPGQQDSAQARGSPRAAGSRNSYTNNPRPQQRNSLSFRASLGLASRNSGRRENDDSRHTMALGGHEKLPSQPDSPNEIEAKQVLPTTPHGQVSKHRNYEYFAGSAWFLFCGRLINTRAPPLNLVTFTLVTIPAILFFVASASWLWHNISPAMPIVFAYVFFLTLSSFFHAAFSDPGILPRNIHPHPPNPEEERDALAPGPPTTEWVMVRTYPRKLGKGLSSSDAALAEASQATAMEVPTKYCKSCQIWRPPRCHHCRICDVCIEGHDHHCVWLNQCVGRRNYRIFFSFIAWATVLSWVVIAFCLAHIGIYADRNGITFRDALSGRWQERTAFAAFLYALLAMPYPGSLCVYHIFLMGRGETTREYLNSHKFALKDRHRPFSMPTMLQNIAVVLSRPRGPSYMEFKRKYVEGDVRMGYSKPRSERKAQVEQEKMARESRVKELMKRFSVLSYGALPGHGRKRKSGVEMKSLPPVPPIPPPLPKSSHSHLRENGIGLNSTPR